MQNKKFLFDRIGTVSQVNGLDRAEIEFKFNNGIEKALLNKDKYYYKGRHIPYDKHLSDYISIGMQVTFSCHVLNNQDNEHPAWYVVLCQKYETKPEIQLKLKAGLVNVAGCVREVQKRHGVLYTDHPNEEDSTIYFLASKFYLDGKRLSSSRALTEVLKVDDMLFFDAIPCIPEENEFHSKWFAVLVFKGKRPESHKYVEYKQFEIEEKGRKNALSLKPYIYECINRYTNDAKTLFAFGTGIIMDVPNEEFGIILGQFQVNQFQSVLFHRKNAFLFKMCLANVDLTQVFHEGDRVNFIAVGAPSGFVTDWIAIQMSILTNGAEFKAPFNFHDIAQTSSTINEFAHYE